MARATVTVAGRTSRPAVAAAPARTPARNSLVDKPFGRPFLVQKIAGKGVKEMRGRPLHKAAFVSEDNTTMIVAPTDTGEPMVFVKREAADKYYRFVRFLTPSEKIEIVGSN